MPVCSYAMRHIQPQCYHVGTWMKLPARWTQSFGRCNSARLLQPGKPKGPPDAGARNANEIIPAAKNVRIFGAQIGTQTYKIRNVKTEPKLVPGCSLAIIIIRKARFWGAVFGTPKCGPRLVFETLHLGTYISSEVYILKKKNAASINPSMRPENPGLPQLDVVVAGRASHVAISRDKMPIKAHLLLLVMQMTTYTSVLKLAQAHNKPDS